MCVWGWGHNVFLFMYLQKFYYKVSSLMCVGLYPRVVRIRFTCSQLTMIKSREYTNNMWQPTLGTLWAFWMNIVTRSRDGCCNPMLVPSHGRCRTSALENLDIVCHHRGASWIYEIFFTKIRKKISQKYIENYKYSNKHSYMALCVKT